MNEWMNNLINAHIQNLTSKCLLPRFMSPQSCASLTSVWSTHLGSLTSWWRGQTGPGELLFHQISRVFVENREEEEEEKEDRATVKKIYIEKDPVWFWWLKNGEKTSCLECPSQPPRSRHTWHRGGRWSMRQPSLYFFPSLPACQRQSWVWLGPVDTKRMPYHMPVCFQQILCSFTALTVWTEHGTIWGKVGDRKGDDRVPLLVKEENNRPGRHSGFSWWTPVM